MLERIILHGFKSFSKRLELEILPGITAFVGPNGCGKSNIGDAIRWALGEQSAKALRSERKIDEVIFHGSQNQKSMKMAEVSLIFKDQNLQTSNDFREAMITRRVFASSESQYLLNNNPCRLKDIQELIYGKGISIKNYSIIPQGKIEQIIDSTGAERRIMIEEASGIIKYKIHKKESLAKLQDAEENLLRVDDILNEIKSNLSSLKRQKSKAQVYKKLKSEKDKIELLLKKSDYIKLNEILLVKNKALEEIKNEAKELDMKLKQVENEHSLLKYETLQCKEKLDKKIAFLSDLTNRLNSLKIRYEQLTFQTKELKEQLDRMSSEVTVLGNNLDKEMEELKGIDTDFNLTKKELELKDENLKQLEKELAEVDNAIKTNNEMSLSLQKEILRCHSDLIDHKNRLRIWENDKKNFEKRAESIKNYISNLKNDITEIKNHLGIITVKSKRNKDTLQALNKLKDTLVSQISDINRELNEVSANMEASRRAKEISSSRLQSLKELLRNLEGFQEGIKAIIGLQKNDPQIFEFSGSNPFLFQNITCDEKYELALQSALGDRTQGIVFDRFEDIKKAIKYLKENKLGRGTFIYKDTAESKEKDVKSHEDSSETKAMSIIKCEDEFKPLFAKLTKDMVVVESLEKALNNFLNRENGENFVTLDGDIVYSDGTIIGGSPESLPSNLIQREREIKRLEVQIQNMDETIQVQDTKIVTLKSRLTEYGTKLDNTENQIYNENISAAGYEKEMEQLGLNLERANRNLSTYQIELVQHEKSSSQIEKEEEKSKLEVKRLEEEIGIKEGEFKSMESRIKEKKELHDKISQETTNAQIKAASLSQKIISLKDQKKRLESLVEERSIKIESLKKATEDAITRIEMNTSEVGKIDVEIKNLEVDLKKNQDEAKAYEDEFKLKTKKLSVFEDTISTLRNMFQGALEKKGQIEIEKARLETELTYVINEISRKFELDVESIEPDNDSILSGEDLNKRLLSVNAKLEKIGDVNLVALEEFQKQKARYEFLTRQKEDLITSIESLKSAIKKINLTSQNRFNAAFAKINEYYKLIFQQLFEGGEAELSYEMPDNPLETGIAMRAKPEGKQLKFISQLSGGEKVLTAISLVLAIFLYNPSPFCVLDEVDASLDDANIWRFTKLIRKFSHDTQFLIISHNQHTIEAADLIYGITMEDGMSKVISLSPIKENNS